MSDKKVISPKFSLKGWTFTKWLKGNGKTIKEIIKVGVPFLVSTYETTNPFLVGLITLAGKFALDVLDYYLKEHVV